VLKNPKIIDLLRSPDNPDGIPLRVEKESVTGASWPIPIVNGIPDFVSYAPPSQQSMTFPVPILERPTREVLSPPVITENPPKWFHEERHKYAILKNHRRGFLLDVGCGQGNRATFEKLGYDYIGLDISWNCQQRNKGPADIDILADCHRLPLPSGCMEIVNCTAVLEHLYWPALAMKEMMRVLKPGGILVGSSSFLEGEHFDSQCHFTSLGLYRLLRSTGLQVCHLYPGLSLWEMHSNSIFFNFPGHKYLGRLHRILYLLLVSIKSQESPQQRLLQHAAILNFVGLKTS